MDAAVIYCSLSAERGCDIACFAIGWIFSFQPSSYLKADALTWFEKGFGPCHCDIATEADKADARDWISRLRRLGH